MDNISAWILAMMDKLGLFGVTCFMFLENVFPPIPSELIMPAAGFAASQGTMGLWAVIIAGTLGSVLGAVPLYYLGTVFDEKRLLVLVNKYGKYVLVKPDDIRYAQSWFAKYGYWVVFFGRMIPAIRSLISIPAGMNKMPMLPFLFLTAVGSAIWTSLLAYAGYVLGANYQQVEQFIAPISKIVVVIVLLIALTIAFFRIKSVFFDPKTPHNP